MGQEYYGMGEHKFANLAWKSGKVYNIKQVAKVLLFLQEHDCRDYETLAKADDHYD